MISKTWNHDPRYYRFARTHSGPPFDKKRSLSKLHWTLAWVALLTTFYLVI